MANPSDLAAHQHRGSRRAQCLLDLREDVRREALKFGRLSEVTDLARELPHQLQYKGATWRFASSKALARFKANPAAYAPQFGGYCAWAVSQGYIAPGDPQQWKIVDGKLYLNFNARAKELWEADQAAAIVRGNANWPKVLSSNQND